MPGIETKTTSGDVYFLNSDDALLYGNQGIELRLGARNLATLKRIMGSEEAVKDVDSRDRRFTVFWDDMEREFVFEPRGREVVRSPAWMFEYFKQAA